jgi:hypothetical protein
MFNGFITRALQLIIMLHRKYHCVLQKEDNRLSAIMTLNSTGKYLLSGFTSLLHSNFYNVLFGINYNFMIYHMWFADLLKRYTVFGTK